jgi:hypothetical protein
MQRFLSWLRNLSGQPWIGDVDRFFERSQKHQFAIDDAGSAIDTPYSVARAHAVGGAHLITPQCWQVSFQRAAHDEIVPAYWNTFYEGLNATAWGDYSGAVMALSRSLETARDENLSRFVPHKFIANVGFRLDPPFAHTDLLDHLTNNLRDYLGRDFSIDHGTSWPHVKHLYLARHHVAHGKGAVYPEGGKLHRVTEETFRQWPTAVRTAIRWLESLRLKR